jgi:hypothetical protein
MGLMSVGQVTNNYMAVSTKCCIIKCTTFLQKSKEFVSFAMMCFHLRIL